MGLGVVYFMVMYKLIRLIIWRGEKSKRRTGERNRNRYGLIVWLFCFFLINYYFYYYVLLFNLKKERKYGVVILFVWVLSE